MEIHYTPKGVCSRQIDIVVEDGVIQSVKFTGGCNGNTQGVAALAQGMKVQEYLDRCKGIHCGARPPARTSWPRPFPRQWRTAASPCKNKRHRQKPFPLTRSRKGFLCAGLAPGLTVGEGFCQQPQLPQLPQPQSLLPLKPNPLPPQQHSRIRMMMSQVQLPLHMEECLLSNYTLSYGGRPKV